MVSIDKLAAKMENLNEVKLDDEKLAEKRAIVKAIDDAKHRIQVDIYSHSPFQFRNSHCLT